jgi:PAS domain-containing protein
MKATNFRDQFVHVEDACALAQCIVDTVREPVVVLDEGLRVIAASRSFYSAFKVSPEETQGKLLYALGDGQWDIPKLRVLLEKIIPERGVMEGSGLINCGRARTAMCIWCPRAHRYASLFLQTERDPGGIDDCRRSASHDKSGWRRGQCAFP